MNKKNTVKNTAALFLSLACVLGATGCDFIRTDNAKDMAQTVANVNITSQLAEADAAYANGISKIIDEGGLQTEIPKRDLVAYFLNTGYNYVESYGYTYKDTFEMLMDTLVSRKIVTQHALVYYMKKGLNADDCMEYIANELKAEGLSEKEKELLGNHPEVSAMKYFLTQNGADTEAYEKALYSLKSAINSSLDSAEANYITATDEDEHDHGDVRTTPTNVGVEKEDYFYKTTGSNGEAQSYEIYTGLNNASQCYGYEELDGSTKTTRMKAYNAFLGNLDDNALLMESDNTSKITEIDYYYVELASQLEQALITKYTDDLIKDGEAELTLGTPTNYLSKRYQDTYLAQQLAYDKDTSAFETAIDALADDTFVMYSPAANYGFVYNILIPFSEKQNRQMTAENDRLTTESEKYAYRATVLSEVVAKDLRDSWFCEEDHANYAYQAKTGEYYGNKSNYVFFEDNYTNTDKYEELSVYYGKYAYNGTVADDGYTVTPAQMGINGFLAEMEGYLSWNDGNATAAASGLNGKIGGVTFNEGYNTGYVTTASGYSTDKSGAFTDYSQFIYYAGKVNFSQTPKRADYFVKNSEAYNAAAKFNELMFAYSTDTGCLNTYMGYMVSPDTTSFVAEFEYAAQYAIRELGVGGYVVCPSTYGWHIIYVTYKYDKGEVYEGGFQTGEMAKEGTFSYLYAEAMKEQYSSEYANTVQSQLITQFDNDDCVTRFTSAYQDLLDLDNA
ncbi:MAG: hypothetical protein IJX98_00785 [Clostridia bacterium]|nr:hypothetical protein [Clostridia bacterium]